MGENGFGLTHGFAVPNINWTQNSLYISVNLHLEAFSKGVIEMIIAVRGFQPDVQIY